MAFLRGAGAVDGMDPAANANPNLLASPDGESATCCICGESHGEMINGWSVFRPSAPTACPLRQPLAAPAPCPAADLRGCRLTGAASFGDKSLSEQAKSRKPAWAHLVGVCYESQLGRKILAWWESLTCLK